MMNAVLTLTWCLIGMPPTTGPDSPLASPAAGRELICRGCEESGNITEDQPMWPCHLVSLFVTGKDPHSPINTPQEHVRWVTDPAHSYVDDGSGGLVVWAHPGAKDAEAIADLDGLTGMEISHGGDSAARELLWDRVLTLCHDRGRPFVWGFAGDDTHSKKQDQIGLSFLVVRLGEFTEQALKKALQSGAFYASNGPLISDIQVAGGTVTIRLPAEAEIRWLKSGQFGVGPAQVGRDVGENRCVKRDAATRQSAYTAVDADGTTDPKAGRFIRAVVIDRDGKIAHTMPFRIVAAGKLENPYPPAGAWYRGQTHNHSDPTGPKQTNIVDLHRAYQQRGHHWAFGTDYGYWLTPFQRYPDVLPTVRGITPDRGAQGQATRITIHGERLGQQARVLIGGRPAGEVKWIYENRLQVAAPADLPVGGHDVTVIDGEFKDTLPLAYTVQGPNADNAGWTSYTTLNSPLPGDQTFCVAFSERRGEATTRPGQDGPASIVWIGTEFGVARFDGRTEQAITRRDNDFIGDAILSIAADRKGNVWFGSFYGLTQLGPDGAWQVYRSEKDKGGIPALPSREVNRCFIDSHDHLWITYNGRSNQASRFDGKQWQHFAPPNAAGQKMSLAVAEDGKGRILVAPRRSGVAVFDGKDWEVWTTKNTGLPTDFVRHIRTGPDGTLYFATTDDGGKPLGGLAVLRDGKWTIHGQGEPARWMIVDGKRTFFPATGLASYRVWDLCLDRAGNCWCATSHGVSRLSPEGKWTTFTTANSGLAFDFVMGVAQAPDGAIWFATARGVSRFQPPR